MPKLRHFPTAVQGNLFCVILIIITQIQLSISFEECRNNPGTDNCCQPYTKGAVILGRNFTVVSYKRYFLTSSEICHLLSYLSGVIFPLSKGKQEFLIRTRPDAFPNRFVKNAFMSNVAKSWESPTFCTAKKDVELIESHTMAGSPHHSST